MQTIVRLGLILGALAVATFLIAAHGVRGLAIVIAGVLALSVPRTRIWQIGAGFLVRVTGSRQRAAMLVMSVLIGCLIAVNLYELLH